MHQKTVPLLILLQPHSKTPLQRGFLSPKAQCEKEPEPAVAP